MVNSLSFTSRTARRAAFTAGLFAAGILLASACSGGSSQSATAAGAGTAAPTTATSAPAPAAKTSVTIATGSSSLGPIVVDTAGHSLYRYDKDTPGSGISACNGACAAAWPAAVIGGQPTAGPGVAGRLSVVVRSDGTRQIALDGHPLYRYSGDQNPGDTTGDGFGGIWHVLHTAPSTAASGASQGVSTPY